MKNHPRGAAGLFPFYPENNRFMGYTLDDMRLGFEVLREAMVKGCKPSIARLYDPEDRAYRFSHFAGDKRVLIFMAEGPQGHSRRHLRGDKGDGRGP